MPLQVCKTIRKKYKANALPIIILSAKGTADAVSKVWCDCIT